MTLRMWMAVSGVLLVMLGLLFAVLAPLIHPLFGAQVPPIPNTGPDDRAIWTGIGFARVFGTALFGMGLVIYLLRSLVTVNNQRAAALVVFMGLGIIAAQTFVQQVTLWGTTAGWVLLVALAALAAGFAYYYFFPGVVVPSPDEMVDLEQDVQGEAGPASKDSSV